MRIASSQDLGRFLRERRTDLGLTQTQFAAKAHVSRRWLSDLEAGKKTAEFGLVLQAIHALGLVVDLQPEEKTSSINLDDVLARYQLPVAERDLL